jgi:hypothetical protein
VLIPAFFPCCNPSNPYRPGRSSSLTAPNGPAQQEVILMAWQEAGLNPGDHQGTAFPTKWMGSLIMFND